MTDQVATLDIRRIQVFAWRAPIKTPVRTSFGIMYDRPAVLVRIEDKEGAYGYGEAWCNFPSCGAEHRARLLETVIAPLLLGQTFTTPQEAFGYMTEKVHVLSLQADEPGPLAQVVAAADIALWDLYSRKAGKPLFRVLGGTQDLGKARMPAYASGINPTDTLGMVEHNRKQGFRSFKFKIGFDQAQDMRNLHEVIANLHQGETLSVDANQAFDLPAALLFTQQLEGMPLQWLEEPLRCDTHFSQWKLLQKQCPVPLAAGENIRSNESFAALVHHKYVDVVQPDICKWGGLSATLPVAQNVVAAGLRYCPHYLGGGIGLMASAHLLAAVGGNGLLEIDVNPNPLRELMAQPYPMLQDGCFPLTEAAGLGVEPLFTDLKPLTSFSCEIA